MSKLKALRKSLSITARNTREKTQHRLIKTGRITIIHLQSLLPSLKKTSNAEKSNTAPPNHANEIQNRNSCDIIEALSSLGVEEMDCVAHNVRQSIDVSEKEGISAESIYTNPINNTPEPDHILQNLGQDGSIISSSNGGKSDFSQHESPATSMTDFSDHFSIDDEKQNLSQNQDIMSEDPSRSCLRLIDIDKEAKLQSKLVSHISTSSSQFTDEFEEKNDALIKEQATDDKPLGKELKLLPTVSDSGQDDGTDHGDDKSDSSDDDDDLENFQHLMKAVNLPALTQLTLKLRQQLLDENESTTQVGSCEVVGEPRCGSYNLAYTLQFDDGVKWIARIPGYGLDPSNDYITKMNSEYNTMEYIASKTTFKLPKVFYWTSDPSIAGVAFGLISCVEGVPLWDLWTDQNFGEEKLVTILIDTAVEMVKLFELRFPRTGTLRFDKQGKIESIDTEVECLDDGISPWHDTRLQGSFECTSKWFADRKSSLERNYNPFLKRRPAESVLRMIIETMPQALRQAPLSLSLADPDAQNIFCDSATGRLTGFIDMDNLHVVPVTVGSAAYPLFLLRDRDPELRIRDIREKMPARPYAEFRKHYAAAFERAVVNAHLPYDKDWTRLSHHTCMIEQAMVFHSARQDDIVESMVFHAYNNAYRDQCYLWEDIRSRLKSDLKAYPYRHPRRLRRIVSQAMWLDEDVKMKLTPQARAFFARKEAEQAASAENVVSGVSSTTGDDGKSSVMGENQLDAPETVQSLCGLVQSQSTADGAAEFDASQAQTSTTSNTFERYKKSISENSKCSMSASSSTTRANRGGKEVCAIINTCEQVCWKLCQTVWNTTNKLMMPVWHFLD